MAIERVLRESNPVSRTGILRDIHYTKDASTGIIVTKQIKNYKGIGQKMKFEQNFSQKQQQTQKLAMTQQLQQSIQVLQYNSEELLAFVENQAMENPLVEVVEPEWQPDYIKASSSSYEGEETNYLNQIPDTKGSLFDSLIEQVHLNYRDTFLRKIVLYLVEYIDLNGFLTISLEEAGKEIGATPIQMLDALTLIQQLEPAGVGARSLQECLMLQTERDDYAPELAYIVLEECFEQLVERKWKEIAQRFSVDLHAVQQIFDYLQTLSPSPGRIFDRSSELYIIPDVRVLVDDENVQVISNRKISRISDSKRPTSSKCHNKQIKKLKII